MAYYEANEADLQRTYISASHIALRTYDEAEEIIKMLEDGADFEDLARRYSLDEATKDIGGMIWPEFGRNETYPTFEEAVFSMEIGTIGGPVETPLGYHVIWLEDRRQVELPFGVVRQYIEDVLIRMAANERLNEMRQEASIIYFNE